VFTNSHYTDSAAQNDLLQSRSSGWSVRPGLSLPRVRRFSPQTSPATFGGISSRRWAHFIVWCPECRMTWAAI